MSKILSGKSAIITGASQGLGLEIAKNSLFQEPTLLYVLEMKLNFLRQKKN